MSRVVSLFVSLMLLVTLGLAQAPRVCVGDGLGGACRPEACACVAACSCNEAHRRATASAETDCCAVESAENGQPTASSCHGPDQWPHFAPSDRLWHAALPPVALLPDWGRPAFEAPAYRLPAAHGAHAPPLQPPRAFA